jgi:subtilisin family serine protease
MCACLSPFHNPYVQVAWAISHPASKKVAFHSPTRPNQLAEPFNEALWDSFAREITLVVSAGNEAADACNFSPSFVPAAITVGASEETDQAASYSNAGSCVGNHYYRLLYPRAASGSSPPPTLSLI